MSLLSLLWMVRRLELQDYTCAAAAVGWLDIRDVCALYKAYERHSLLFLFNAKIIIFRVADLPSQRFIGGYEKLYERRC